jgi:hypothetical protein
MIPTLKVFSNMSAMRYGVMTGLLELVALDQRVNSNVAPVARVVGTPGICCEKRLLNDNDSNNADFDRLFL